MVKDFHVFHYSANRRAYGHQSVQLGGYTIWWGDPAEYGDVVYPGWYFHVSHRWPDRHPVGPAGV